MGFSRQEYWSGLPFFKGSSLPRIQTWVSCIAGRFSTIWATRKTLPHRFTSAQFSHLVISNSLWPHGLPHNRLPCPSPTSAVYSNSCPLGWWCHPTISFSVAPFSSWLQFFPASGFFSDESVLLIRWPKHCSFSFRISPLNECSGPISFRMDWLDLLAVQRTLKSQYQFFSAQLSW